MTRDHLSSKTPRGGVSPALRHALAAMADDPGWRDRIPRDAVAVPLRYSRPGDREVAALLAALFAFGRVTSFQGFLGRLLERLGPSPLDGVRDRAEAELRRLARGLRYRWVGEGDVGSLLSGMRRVLVESGSFLTAFRRGLREGEEDYREELSRFVALLSRGWREDPGRAGRYLLPDPARGSAAKRLNLFMRWMVRPDDGIDLGLWRCLETARLVVPLDTHVHRVALRTGLVRSKTSTWSTAAALTRALRQVDPADPVRLDFALCHLGMSGRCTIRLTAVGCSGCPLIPGCRTGRRRTRAKAAARTDLLSTAD